MSTMSFAYAGLGVSDVAAWADFAVDILGMEDCGPATDGERRLRMDEKAWRLALHTSSTNDLAFAGFEISDEESLVDLAKSLKRGGVPVREMMPAQVERRRAQSGFLVEDPDGLAIELVHGLRDGTAPFRSPRAATFVTGVQGLGHMVVSTSDAARSLAFYRILGFKISDYIEFDFGPHKAIKVAFLHCNERHHTLALLPLAMPRRLDHMMFEVSSIDTVLMAYNRARQRSVPIVRHMGRHTNDRMLSFYAKTPSGFDVEIGCGGIHIEGEWEIRKYDAISVWGHES